MQIQLTEKEAKNVKKMVSDIEYLDNTDYNRPEANTVETALELAKKVEEQE